mgnify:CR=1 FL=1
MINLVGEKWDSLRFCIILDKGKAIAVDKYEYKIRSEEIKTLIAKGEYEDAAAIADTIDWRRVKSVMMLCTVSDLYKINRRYEDARELLLLAYDRHPGGRSIVYSLCELCIKMDDFVPAVEYYKEFVQVAPKDSGRYVLQYKLYEAQDVSLEERIEVLEELKAKEYSEKWAYELAYLYHRVGLATKCVEECDEMIVWFGEGKYVLKAMELKQLHEPLTPEQQEKYEEMKGLRRGESVPSEPEREEDLQDSQKEEDLADAPTKEIPQDELDIQVKLMNVGQYDTINMQKELAQNMKELWEGTSDETETQRETETADTEVAEEIAPEAGETARETAEDDEEYGEVADEAAEKEIHPQTAEPEERKVEEVFFGETGEIDPTGTQILEEMKKEALGVKEEPEKTEEAEAKAEAAPAEKAGQAEDAQGDSAALTSTQTGDMKEWHVDRKPGGFEKILGMEYDGQMSMVVPESEQVEKQITGQISLEDVLLEWEKMKKDSEQKRMEAVRQHVMQQTGAMFTEFEAATRDGLLEKLENGTVDGDEMPGETADTDIEDIGEVEELEEIEEADSIPDAGNEALAAEEPEDAVYEPLEEFAEEETFEEEPEEAADIEEALEETEEPGDAEEALEEESEETGEELEEAPEGEAEATEEIVDAGEEPDEEAFTEESEEATGEEAFVEEPDEAVSGETFTEEPEESGDAEEALEEESEEAEETVEETEEASEEENTESEAAAGEEAPEETEETADGEEETAEEGSEPRGARPHNRRRRVRPMSPEEKQNFGTFAQNRNTRDQIVYAIDNISMAAYTGNLIITGEEGMDTLALAKKLIREVQQNDSNFSGKIAKISGESLNRKGIEPVFEKLANGALIVQNAGGMSEETIEQMQRALNQEHSGMIVVLEDAKKTMHKLLRDNHTLAECFNIEINIEALDNDSLVAYAAKYAREQEYSIDELGILALHTRIAERQTSDHAVTPGEVQEMVDQAIHHANRKTLGHFFDILIAKRYDDEDMIILREKDFM